jgi:hypothetical protein
MVPVLALKTVVVARLGIATLRRDVCAWSAATKKVDDDGMVRLPESLGDPGNAVAVSGPGAVKSRV